MQLVVYDLVPDRSASLLESWAAALPNNWRLSAIADPHALREALADGVPDMVLLLVEEWPRDFSALWLGLPERPPLWVCSFLAEDAAEAYRHRAVGFTPAPVDVPGLRTALGEFAARTRSVPFPERSLSGQPAPSFFFVRSDYKIIRVETSEILFVESLGEYIRIHTAEQRITTLYGLGNLMAVLPQDRFFRIHRSYIVNVAKISFVQNNIVAVGKHQLSVSKGQKASFLAFLEKIGLLG
jgi:DNA-binding LytR/AlgR family response regulator